MTSRGNKDTALDDAVAHLKAKSVDVVMFTDHHKLPGRSVRGAVEQPAVEPSYGARNSTFSSTLGRSRRQRPKSRRSIHLLVGFDPEENADYWFTDLMKRCGNEERDVSGTMIPGLTAPAPDICKRLQDANALIIPAHLHKRSDAFKSRSVDDIFMDAEFLKLAREHFTALEVTDLKTAEFFDGEHAETGNLRKTCIRSSDAHEVTGIGERVTWVQMEEPTFKELKRG